MHRDSSIRPGTVLMCPPDYYGIEYEINPWMRTANPADAERSKTQWSRLTEAMSQIHLNIQLLPPVKGLPDMVFSANGGLVYCKKFIPSRFRHPERQGEQEHWENWFSEHDYEVITLPQGMYFEGAGDALFADSVLFGGYGQRSDKEAYTFIADALGVDVYPVELIDPRFYHLDISFCPLSDHEALYYPGAISDEGKKILRKRLTLYEVPEEEALRFVCNAVVHEKGIVMPSGCPATTSMLNDAGWTVYPVELAEFMKAGELQNV